MNDWIDPLATLVAAFAGSWAAFVFERHKKSHEQAGQAKSAANRALFTLVNMWNGMYQYKNEVVEPYRGKPDAWLNMAATSPAHRGLAQFDSIGLSFLLDDGVPQLYMEIMLEEQRFWGTVQLIEERNKILMQRVFPALGQAGLPVPATLPESELTQIIGHDTAHILKKWTGAITEQVTQNCATHVAAFFSLRNQLKATFPGAKFVDADFGVGNSAK